MHAIRQSHRQLSGGVRREDSTPHRTLMSAQAVALAATPAAAHHAAVHTTAPASDSGTEATVAASSTAGDTEATTAPASATKHAEEGVAHPLSPPVIEFEMDVTMPRRMMTRTKLIGSLQVCY